MGLGGYLTWTAVIREICQRDSSINQRKIVPVEAREGMITKVVRSPVFDDNPNA